MKSTIRVKHDFNNNEPYLQLRLDGVNEDDADLKDEHLNQLIEISKESLLYVYYGGSGSGLPQIRPLTHYSTTEECMQRVIHAFEDFSRKYFQDSEMQHVESFFSALRVKCHLKYDKVEAAIKTPQSKIDPFKTRRDYFELSLSQEWRIKAFENTPVNKLDESVVSLFEAMKYVKEYRDENGY